VKPFAERVRDAREDWVEMAVKMAKDVTNSPSQGRSSGIVAPVPLWAYLLGRLLLVTLVICIVVGVVGFLLAVYLLLTVVYWVALGVAKWKRRHAV
jgi:Flp pilus assembly protein TadB